MSDKEKALDALQEIIHISSSLLPPHANNEVLAQSETIRRVLHALPEQQPAEERISCYYMGMPGHSVPLADARRRFNSCDAICASCGRCQ